MRNDRRLDGDIHDGTRNKKTRSPPAEVATTQTNGRGPGGDNTTTRADEIRSLPDPVVRLKVKSFKGRPAIIARLMGPGLPRRKMVGSSWGRRWAATLAASVQIQLFRH